MALFLQNFLSFPVVIYSGMLVLVALYWLSASLGLLDLDVLDGDVSVDGADGLADGMDLDGALDGALDGLDAGDGGDLGADAPDGAEMGADASEGASQPDGLAGLMLKLGIHGVPVTVSLTFITLGGWLMSYFAVHYGLRHMEAGLARYGAGVVLFVVAFFAATKLASVLIVPVRPLFRKHTATRAQGLAGKTVTVRSATVSSERGEAVLEDGGAGLILQVRTLSASIELLRGQKAVIRSYDPLTHTYTVVPELDA